MKKHGGFSLMEFVLSLTILSICIFIWAQWCNFKQHQQALNRENLEILPYINVFSWLMETRQLVLHENDCWYGTQNEVTKVHTFSREEPKHYACRVEVRAFNEKDFRICFYGHRRKRCIFEFYQAS